MAEIAFTYDESDNKIVVTGGDSGTPATFASFVTADRAGTAELTPEDTPDACTTNMTLTYQIRPVEDLALQISFILSGTSAGGGDTLDVTGTDWDGQAQNESIDVSGGNATYNGAYKWRTITDIDCTGWADGTLQVTQPQWGVIWDKGEGQYAIDCLLAIGGGDISTYFRTSQEQIHFELSFSVLTDATFQSGLLYGSWGYAGSYIDEMPHNTTSLGNLITWGGTLKFYDSHLHLSDGSNGGTFYLGVVEAKNSTFSTESNTLYAFRDTMTTVDFRKCYINHLSYVDMRLSPDVFSDVHIHYCGTGINAVQSSVTASGLLITSASTREISLFSSVGPKNFILDDLEQALSSDPSIGGDEGSTVSERYTCNIHIADKNGANLASASVDCEYANLVEGSDNKTYKCIQDHTAVDATHKPITGTDWTDYWVLYSDTENFMKPSWETGFDYKHATTEFSTQATDANGDITGQKVQYRKWVSTAEYEEQRLHKFTITYAGLETLVLESITVDSPISWHLELQPMRARNYARSRLQGVQFQ